MRAQTSNDFTGAGPHARLDLSRHARLLPGLALFGRIDGTLAVGRVSQKIRDEVANPDGVHNQIEGGIVQSSSWTLEEEVRFDRTRILSRDWGGYPILRFPRVPQTCTGAASVSRAG